MTHPSEYSPSPFGIGNPSLCGLKCRVKGNPLEFIWLEVLGIKGLYSLPLILWLKTKIKN